MYSVGSCPVGVQSCTDGVCTCNDGYTEPDCCQCDSGYYRNPSNGQCEGKVHVHVLSSKTYFIVVYKLTEPCTEGTQSCSGGNCNCNDGYTGLDCCQCDDGYYRDGNECRGKITDLE